MIQVPRWLFDAMSILAPIGFVVVLAIVLAFPAMVLYCVREVSRHEAWQFLVTVLRFLSSRRTKRRSDPPR